MPPLPPAGCQMGRLMGALAMRRLVGRVVIATKQVSCWRAKPRAEPNERTVVAFIRLIWLNQSSPNGPAGGLMIALTNDAGQSIVVLSVPVGK